MQNILPEVVKDVVSFDWLALRKCDEHGAAILWHGDDNTFVGRLELQVAADEASLVAAQQVVQAVVENERAHTVEEVGDATRDVALVDGEEVGVVHVAVLAERGEERGRQGRRDVPHAKAVDEAAALVEQVA